MAARRELLARIGERAGVVLDSAIFRARRARAGVAARDRVAGRRVEFAGVDLRPLELGATAARDQKERESGGAHAQSLIQMTVAGSAEGGTAQMTTEERSKGGRDLSFGRPSAVARALLPRSVPRRAARGDVHDTSISADLAQLSPNWTDGP